MKKEESKEVAVKEEAGLPAESGMRDLIESDSGVGFEGTGQADFAIPQLKIIQKGSPQCTEGDPLFDETARPGMYLNTVTNERWGKEGVLFVPALYQRVGALWVPGKTDGTGYRGTVPSSELDIRLRSTTKDEKGHDITPDGLMLVDTRQWFGLTVSEDLQRISACLLSLKSTQLKKSKKWLAYAQALRYGAKCPPLYSQMYRLTSAPEKNDQGAWMGLLWEHAGEVPRIDIALEAKKFRSLIESGAVKVEMEGAEEDFSGGETDKF